MPRERMAEEAVRERGEGGGGVGEDELIDSGNHNKALLLMTRISISLEIV